MVNYTIAFTASEMIDLLSRPFKTSTKGMSCSQLHVLHLFLCNISLQTKISRQVFYGTPKLFAITRHLVR